MIKKDFLILFYLCFLFGCELIEDELGLDSENEEMPTIPFEDRDQDGFLEINSINDLLILAIDESLDTITTYKGFELMRDLDFKNSESYSDDSLMSLITAGASWIEIRQEGRFPHIFEGNNYAISNLYINNPGEDFVGLFNATTETSEIRNLNLINVSIMGNSRVAGLVGRSRGAIVNCNVSGSISGNSYVGMLCGEVLAGFIDFCLVEGEINGENYLGGLAGSVSLSRGEKGSVKKSVSNVSIRGEDYLGGIVGYLSGQGAFEVSSCYSLNTIRGNDYVGGAFGYASSNGLTIENCYSSNAVLSDGSYLGGFIGQLRNGNIYSCLSLSSVTGGSTLIGGFSGRATIVNTNYWDIEVSGVQESSGGTGYNTTQLQAVTDDVGIYITWSDDAWNFGNTNQYPTLIGLPVSVENQQNFVIN